jgi:nucleoid DNA-binding protein
MAKKAAANTNTKAKSMTKSAIFQELATKTNLSKKQIGEVFDALADLIQKQLAKKGPGVFTIPGMLKLTRKDVPPKPPRQGINPQTRETVMYPAKPASVTVRARALKALKDTVK